MNKEEHQFGTMPEHPILNVGESNVWKMDKEQKNEDKHDQFILSCCCVSIFTEVISTFLTKQQAVIKEIGVRSILDLRRGRLMQEFYEIIVH